MSAFSIMDQRQTRLLLIYTILRRRMLYRRLLWENDQRKFEIEHQRMLFSLRRKTILLMIEQVKMEMASQQKENNVQCITNSTEMQSDIVIDLPKNVEEKSRRRLLVGTVLTPQKILQLPKYNVKWCEMQFWSETQWKTHFRLSTKQFTDLCNVLQQFAPTKIDHVPIEMQVAIFLHKLASGLEYKYIAELFCITESFSKHVFCVIVKTLYKQIVNVIYMPNPSESHNIAMSFEQLCGLPQVIGCIGGFHIPITPPKSALKKFINKKGFPSLNMQIVVDNKLCIRYFSCLFPGSSGNGKAFVNSSLFKQYKTDAPYPKESLLGKKVPYILLGNGSYPLRSWLIKKYAGSVVCDEKLQFNERVNCGRNKVRNAIKRVLKKWKILTRQSEIDYKLMPTVAGVCCAMHNLIEGVDIFHANEDSENVSNFCGEYVLNGKEVRDHLCVYLAINKNNDN